MQVEVKICGLRTEPALEAAIAGGAEYVGFVFYPPSPRSLTLAAAETLAQRVQKRAKIVVLAVNPTDDALREIVAAVGPDIIQLHGHETPERVREIRATFGRPVMKAISVRSAEDAAEALRYQSAADLILFDAKAPADLKAALPGGNGISFDWHALDGVKGSVRYMLSGGLNPDNVADAIRLTGAGSVDVSSGVETAPGEKDPDLIRRFLAAAKGVCSGHSETTRKG